MASTEAVAIISGGSAVAGAFIGAAAGHFTTIRSQKLQADEEHFRHRQGVYHDFLLTVAEFRNGAMGIQLFDSDAWASWHHTFELRRAAVNLFGDGLVIDKANRLMEVIEEVVDDTPEAAGSDFRTRREAAFRDHVDAFVVRSNDVMDAMRDDISPK